MASEEPSLNVPHHEHLTFVDLVQGKMRPVEEQEDWYRARAQQRKDEYDAQQRAQAQQGS